MCGKRREYRFGKLAKDLAGPIQRLSGNQKETPNMDSHISLVSQTGKQKREPLNSATEPRLKNRSFSFMSEQGYETENGLRKQYQEDSLLTIRDTQLTMKQSTGISMGGNKAG